jgi:hypothetical protein
MKAAVEHLAGLLDALENAAVHLTAPCAGPAAEADIATLITEAGAARVSLRLAQAAIDGRQAHEADRALHTLNNRLTGVIAFASLARLDIPAGACAEQLSALETQARACASSAKALAKRAAAEL